MIDIRYTEIEMLDFRDLLEKYSLNKTDYGVYNIFDLSDKGLARAVMFGEYYQEWSAMMWISYSMRKWYRHLSETLKGETVQLEFLKDKFIDSLKENKFDYYKFICYVLTNYETEHKDLLISVAAFLGAQKRQFGEPEGFRSFKNTLCIVWGRDSGTFVGKISDLQGNMVYFNNAVEFKPHATVKEILDLSKGGVKMYNLCVLDVYKVTPLSKKLMSDTLLDDKDEKDFQDKQLQGFYGG